MIPVPMRHAMGLKGLEPFEEDQCHGGVHSRSRTMPPGRRTISALPDRPTSGRPKRLRLMSKQVSLFQRSFQAKISRTTFPLTSVKRKSLPA